MLSSLIVLCLIACVRSDEGKWRQIETPQGPVRGRRDPAGLYIFSNIPYATVPSGPNKFGAPSPPPIWLQPLETSNKPIICPQPIMPLFEGKVMQEDCLIANIYVPITIQTNLPVVVYIHGGAFELGYGDLLTPKNFVKQNEVIVVTFNYRLGVHGFLCLGTDDIPGNAGMKDQVQLLKWVKKNIASYGGDPEDVTIAGYSAGSVSVDLLMLAKSAQGLFNKVIQESGAAVASISVQINPLESAKILARKLNFTDVDDVYALEEFYKNTPLEMLLGSTFADRTDASIPFGPCVERKSSLAFLSDAPVNRVGFLNITDESQLSEEFKNMKRTMRDLWNNFVRHGKPVPEGSSFPSWPSADANRSPYMSLGQTMQLESSLLESRARFWDDIYQRYYREPTPPPNPPKSEL
ncbi:unnamed protein product [Arctia plantaginis]|uniref:Carboxylesterase type B domain-containing protein n=1 Tax=Arctia plantaginis TaxID=874455 RepID=A0A8S1A089_ARCPL|nr:unnamed protein product [Arctia plantaginis]